MKTLYKFRRASRSLQGRLRCHLGGFVGIAMIYKLFVRINELRTRLCGGKEGNKPL